MWQLQSFQDAVCKSPSTTNKQKTQQVYLQTVSLLILVRRELWYYQLQSVEVDSETNYTTIKSHKLYSATTRGTVAVQKGIEKFKETFNVVVCTLSITHCFYSPGRWSCVQYQPTTAVPQTHYSPHNTVPSLICHHCTVNGENCGVITVVTVLTWL